MSSADSVNGERPPWFDIEVSMVSSATETKTIARTIGSILADIGSVTWKIPIERVRDKFSTALAKATEEGNPDPAAEAKNAVSTLKKELPGFCGSGNFLERADDKLVTHSGFLWLDLDDLGERLEPIRQQLKNDPYVQVVFVSPTGSGLKVLIPIEASKESHYRSFLAARKYFRDTYDVAIDEKCRNVSRICFVSHDPDIFIREEEAAILKPLPHDGEIKRPGVSEQFLRAHGVRHVEMEEAETLLGYRPSGGGLWIPYFSQDGGGPLMVNGRKYGRLRLDKPTRDAKYLSAKGSGAQLYVPTAGFERELVICEGEFKALSLCEAGVAAVAIGGVSSALPRGELLPDLRKLFSKFPAFEKVLFLGDADTLVNFEFSREAVKLARALREGVELKLPRIPIGGPNGIDDCREELGAEFLEFWEEIKAGAVEVTAESEPSTIAAELLIRELPAIGKVADWKKKYQEKIFKLAGRLEPVALDEVARAVKEHFGISVGAFKEQAAKAGKLLSPIPIGLPKIYFDGFVYYRENEGKSGYESIGRADVMLDLRKNGWPHNTAKGMETSPCEDALHQLQLQNRIDYAGPFCGRPPGLYREKEVTILCTRGPVIIEGKQGDAGPVKVFLESLLGKGRDPFFEQQRLAFFGWLKHGRTALRRHEQDLPGQVLGLVGPRDCGKSLLQTIITMCLGGREADPSLHLVKGNDFNSEMWCAEHLRLGDEELMEDGRSGVHKLRERLKKAAVATLYPFHAKHVDAKNARPIWRLTISGNDDSESIAVLPPPTDSFSDKVNYLQCYAPLVPYHDGSAEGRNTFWKRLMEALPAFLWEIDKFELPEELRDSRFFVKAWHHPRVVELIEDASPVAPLGELLASEIEKRGGKPLEGTATEIYKELGPVLSGIASSAAHFAHMVKRLQKLEGWKNYVTDDELRIGPNRMKQTKWTIVAPSDPRF